MVLRCMVKGCKNSHVTTKMHVFPKDPETFKMWTQAICRTDLCIEKVKSYRICDIHFSEDQKFQADHNKTNLKKNAVPYLHLPVILEDPNYTQPGTSKDVQTFLSSNDEPSVLRTPSPPQLKRSQETETATSTPVTPPLKKMKVVVSPKTPTFCKDIRSRINLLRLGNVRHQSDLTPKSRRFYKVAKDMLRTARQLFHENASNKERLEKVLKLTESKQFLQGKVNNATLNFIESQLKQQTKKNRGRRFSIEDKIFALSLLKQSPKCYRLLQRTFALPSRKTLMNLLRKIPFHCGLNKHILNSLGKSVENMKEIDRYCCLLFDEMWLEASLTYNQRQNCILGFEDTGCEKRSKFADHAMVFMARGISRKWKQPVCYYFSEGGMSTPELMRVVKQVIKALQEIGLKVVATICDQLSTNTAVINHLKTKTNEEFNVKNKENVIYGFCVGGEEIIPLYDPPHLLKGLRNNMLEGNVKFTWQNNEQIASWNDIVALYELDVGDYDTRMANKLTNQHIYKAEIKKMKVKNAAQVFSQRVSSIMRGIVRLGNGQLPDCAANTADFLLFVDKLFDSVNGSVINADHGKVLRCAVKPDSPHIDFWYESIKVFHSVKFFSDRRREYVPPTVRNWISTLRGFVYLWKKLKEAGFDFLCTRNLNQDPLENFFGCIRSHGVRNINPTCSSLVASFKSLLINNFASPHSPGANCEQDESDGALNTLKDFLVSDDHIADTTTEVENDINPDPDFQFSNNRDILVINTHAYIAGFLARAILKYVGTCPNCRNQLLSQVSEPEHQLIEARAYSSRALVRPNTQFIKFFSKCNDVVHHYLPKLCVQSMVKQKIIKLLFNHIHFKNFSCTSHNLPDIFTNKFVHFYIIMWVKNVNRILRGDHCKQINDNIKIAALNRHRKYKTRKNKIKELKRLQ